MAIGRVPVCCKTCGESDNIEERRHWAKLWTFLFPFAVLAVAKLSGIEGVSCCIAASLIPFVSGVLLVYGFWPEIMDRTWKCKTCNSMDIEFIRTYEAFEKRLPKKESWEDVWNLATEENAKRFKDVAKKETLGDD